MVLPRGLGPAPTAEGVPRAGGGAPGRRVCFPALGAASAGCTGCGAAARVDEGAQRAPHPNGLSFEEGGGGRGRLVAVWPPGVAHNCTRVHGAVLALASVMKLEGHMHTWRFPGQAAQGIPTAVKR